MKNKIAILFIILCGLFFYTLTIRGVVGNGNPESIKDNLDQATKPFELSPERGRYAHVYSLAEHNTYALDQQWADAVYPDVGYSNGKFYSFFAPGISYMSTPFYLLGAPYDLGQVFTFGFISLMSIFAMIFLFKIAREIFNLPLWASLFSVFVFAFGSTAWGYAITLYQHHLTTFFIVSSFYAVWRYAKNTSYSWVWALFVWINYALAISIDYPNAILMLPIMIYLLISSISIKEITIGHKVHFRYAIILTFIAFILLSGLHAYHNQYYFGNWKTVSGGLPGYKTIKEQNIFSSSNSTEQINTLQTKKSIVGFFKEKNLVNGFYTLTTSTDRGIFFYCPIFLLAFFGIWNIRKRLTTESLVLLSCTAVNVFLYSSWGDPWGGWAYGPRYLIPSMAFLSILVAIWVSQKSYDFLRKVTAFFLFAFSSAIGLLGALTTNAVPPKIEADYLHMGYNFIYNWSFFIKNESGSFIYNTYIHNSLTLEQYAFMIYALLILLITFILFIMPIIKHES